VKEHDRAQGEQLLREWLAAEQRFHELVPKGLNLSAGESRSPWSVDLEEYRRRRDEAADANRRYHEWFFRDR
jgi:hypothetical protein